MSVQEGVGISIMYFEYILYRIICLKRISVDHRFLKYDNKQKMYVDIAKFRSARGLGMKEKSKKNIFAAFHVQPHKFKGLDYNFSKICEIAAHP